MTDIVEVMVKAAREAVSGYPHTQTLTFQMRAALTALSAAGYAVVPVKPTEEMIDAASEVLSRHYLGEGVYDVRGPVIRQMLEAALAAASTPSPIAAPAREEL